jgi:hypothetical protein
MANELLKNTPDQEIIHTKVMRAFFGTIRHFFGSPRKVYEGVDDPRNPQMIFYPLSGVLFAATFLFVCRLGSRRAVQAKLRGNQAGIAKFAAWFGVENIPHGDTLNYSCQRVKVEQVQDVICGSMEKLIRQKVFLPYRLLGMYYLVVIDGTGVITYSQRHCAHCLKKVLHNGETHYYHPVLEAKLVTRNGFAFSLMTEFIENQELGGDKQDCELRAFYRLAGRIKKRFPRLPICLLLDGLYAGGPTFEICEKNLWKYLIVLREDDLPNVHRSYAAVLPHLPHNHKQTQLGKHDQIVQEYAWAEDLAYTDGDDHSHSLRLIECTETKPNPQTHSELIHYKWLTNFSLTSGNVDLLANQGGRLRWKIENEGFNVQKNLGFNLQHPYSHDPNASKVFYLLMQLACILFQLMEKGSLLQDAFPNGWSSSRHLAFLLLEAWRNLALSAEAFLRLGEGKFQIRFNNSS